MKMAWFTAFVFACLLAALVAYGVRDRLARRHPIAASNYTAEVERALQEYYLDHQAYPEGDNRAVTLALTERKKSQPKDTYLTGKRRHIQEERLLDPWSQEMRIRIIDGQPVVNSAGADGVFDTGDDIDSERFLALKPYPPLPEPVAAGPK